MIWRNAFRSLILFLISFSSFLCLAETSQRTADLTAPDGLKLKATYFSAGKAGPGVLLLHQCNRQRKVWDGLCHPPQTGTDLPGCTTTRLA